MYVTTSIYFPLIFHFCNFSLSFSLFLTLKSSRRFLPSPAMKKQLPSIKSPRFSSSSSSSSSPSSTRTRNKPEPRPDYAWALSLHVPWPQEGNSIRRSARFASESRTSPALTLTEGENVVFSERCLRSRTVLMKRVVSERRGRGKGKGKAAAEIEMLALTPVSRNAEQSVELLSKEKCSSEEGVITEKKPSSRIVQFRHNVAEDAVRKRDRSEERCRSVQLKQNVADQKKKKRKDKGVLCCFIGEPIRRKKLGEDGNGDMI